VPQVPARTRITTRLRQAAGAAVADGNRTIVQAARDLGLSWPVVHAAFTAHAAAVLPIEPEPVTVLGIDEVRRGKPRWSFDEVTQSWTIIVDRWHIGFCDLIGGQGLLDLLALARTHPDRETIAGCCTASTPAAPRLTCSNYTASPPRSRPGGQKSSRSCTPASPTPAQKAPTASSKPSPATPTDSATPKTNASAPARPPPATTADTSTPLTGSSNLGGFGVA
jgi:hypothetical protein